MTELSRRVAARHLMAYDCTKCYKHIPDNDIWEAFGTLYHQKCAPKNAKKRSKSELATSPSETAGLFSPDPEKAKKQLEPLFRAVQDAAKSRDAEAIGQYMAEISKLYRKHPELQKEGRFQQASRSVCEFILFDKSKILARSL